VSSAPAPRASHRLLVLWDVDHTLIETRGVGRAIYERAFPAATGKPLAALAAISGRTELDIMAESLRINGVVPSGQMITNLARELIQGYEDARDELRARGRAMPGAQGVLASLASDPAVYQSVLTGNLREVARIKLEVFGLDGYLDLASGAYGDDDSDRSKLVQLARQRTSDRTGVAFSNDVVVLIGDTPKDVEAAVMAGVRAIGIATGKTTAQELHEAGAHNVASDLPGCQEILRRLAQQQS
jgi:phosphoglycolate phosphatase